MPYSLLSDDFNRLTDLLAGFALLTTPTGRDFVLSHAGISQQETLMRNLRTRLDTAQPAAIYANTLITALLDFGEVTPGKPALFLLLEWLRAELSGRPDDRAFVEGLLRPAADLPTPFVIPTFPPDHTLTWGDELEPERPNPDPAHEGIIGALFALFPAAQGRILPGWERLSAGLSGAAVFIIQIQRDHAHTESAFAKIDYAPRIERECRIHARVCQSRIGPYVPKLLCESLGPVDGWSAAIYQPAGETRLFARSLDGILTAEQGTLTQKTAPLRELLGKALAAWHGGLYRIPLSAPDDTRNWIPTLIEAMLNLGGKHRTGDALRDRAQEHGFAANGAPRLLFEDLQAILPNPIAYILDERYWRTEGGGYVRIDAPRSPVHGDLHGGNIIGLIDPQTRLPLPKAPFLIDFALSAHAGIPFYDLSYLEIDILLRRMPTRPAHTEDWRRWIEMVGFLSSTVWPQNAPPNEELERIWALIRPIREYATALIALGGDMDTRAQYERAFWLSSMAAGVMVTRRSRMEPPEKHKASLLYAAHMLNTLMARLDMRLPNVGTPYPIDWSRRALTEDMVKAYYEAAKKEIIDKYRKEFATLEEWAVPLEGVQRPQTPERPPEVPAAMTDLDPDMIEWMQMMGETGGKHLPADQPDADLPAALDDAAPVEDVPARLMNLSRVVLIGEPGAGKTVTLEQLMVRHAAARAKDTRHPIPVLVPLSRFDGSQPFADFARAYLLTLREYAADLPLVWLLDALNEMPNTGVLKGAKDARALLPEVVQFLNDELQTGEAKRIDRRFVLSCRVADYNDDLRGIPGVDKVTLRPLSPAQIQRVIDRRLRKKNPSLAAGLWQELKGSEGLLRAYDAFAKASLNDEFWDGKPGSVSYDVCWFYVHDDTQRAEYKTRREKGESISWDGWPEPFAADMTARKAMLEDERGLFRLARNPFDLNLIIGLAALGLDKLPTSRAGLLVKQVDFRLNYEAKEGKQRNDPTWGPETLQRIKNTLIQVAEAIQRTEQRTEIAAAEALAAVTDPNAVDLLRKAERATLIQYRDTVRFGHQLWQEYFAALRLLSAIEQGKTPDQFFEGNWWELDAWRESLKILGQVGGNPQQLIRWVAPYAPELALVLLPEKDSDGAGRGVAAQTDSTGEDPLRQAVIAGALARKEEPDPRGRAIAWRVIGRFKADPRPGVLDFDIQWCDVPGGPFQMGGNGEYDGKPIHTVEVAAFRIAKYPVTYRQFQAFIDAPDGFNNPEWWAGLHEDGLNQQRGGPGDQAFKFWNHPRERVSWYDAVAFCRWLSRKLGYEVRLPTEAEWEKAARWDGQRSLEYPYGDTYDPTKSNTDDTGIGQTSAVGIFPDGAAPCGALDMSGNVWEWVSSQYTDYPYRADDGREDLAGNANRVLRGGSWYDFDYVARGAVRGWGSPGDRGSLRGFRCARFYV